MKQVKSVQSKNKRMFMAYDLEPAKELTGGVWYTDNLLDEDFVESVRSAALSVLKQCGGAASPRRVQAALRRKGIFTGKDGKIPTPGDMYQLMQTMVEGGMLACGGSAALALRQHVREMRSEFVVRFTTPAGREDDGGAAATAAAVAGAANAISFPFPSVPGDASSNDEDFTVKKKGKRAAAVRGAAGVKRPRPVNDKVQDRARDAAVLALEQTVLATGCDANAPQYFDEGEVDGPLDDDDDDDDESDGGESASAHESEAEEEAASVRGKARKGARDRDGDSSGASSSLSSSSGGERGGPAPRPVRAIPSNRHTRDEEHAVRRLFYLLRPGATAVAALDGYTEVPCGVCPVAKECTPGGVISPETCVYMTAWLNA